MADMQTTNPPAAPASGKLAAGDCETGEWGKRVTRRVDTRRIAIDFRDTLPAKTFHPDTARHLANAIYAALNQTPPVAVAGGNWEHVMACVDKYSEMFHKYVYNPKSADTVEKARAELDAALVAASRATATPRKKQPDAEPVGWANLSQYGTWTKPVKSAEKAKQLADEERTMFRLQFPEVAVPLYRHPSPVSGAVAAGKGVVEAINNLFRNADLLVELADEDTDSEDFAARLADTKEALLNVKPLLAQITELPEPSEYVKQQCKMNSDCRIVLNFPANKSLDYAAALIEAAAKEGK